MWRFPWESAGPWSPSKQGNTLGKPQKLLCIPWGMQQIPFAPCPQEQSWLLLLFLFIVKNLSKFWFIVIKEVHTGFFHSVCWKPKARAGNLFAVIFSHKINPIYTLSTGNVCLGSEFKLGAFATNWEQIGLMGLSPLNILCGFFYPLGGKHDWSKSVLILGILCGVSFDSLGQGDH